MDGLDSVDAQVVWKEGFVWPSSKTADTLTEAGIFGKKIASRVPIFSSDAMCLIGGLGNDKEILFAS